MSTTLRGHVQENLARAMCSRGGLWHLMVASGRKMHIKFTYELEPGDRPGSPKTQADEMPVPARKITEDLRARALRRVDGQLVPSVTKDTEIRGFALVVTTRRAFWCLFF